MRHLATVLLVILAAGATHWWLGSNADELRETGVPGDGPGITVLRLRGTPREKGRTHGAALAGPIRQWLERLRPQDAGVRAFAVETCGRRLLPFLPPALREELEGVAEGAGISPLEALFLNTSFELAGFRLAGASPMTGEAAVGPGPWVCRHFDTPPPVAELVLVVHDDLKPPLVLVGLPGMVGGFAGVRRAAAAALVPMRVATPPVLNGLAWPLLLRVLLEKPPRPGAALPAKVTVAASVPMRLPDGAAGVLNVAPASATWFAGGAFAVTSAAMGGGPPGVIEVGPVERRTEARARAMRERQSDGGLRLRGGPDSCVLEAWNGATRARVTIRYGG